MAQPGRSARRLLSLAFALFLLATLVAPRPAAAAPAPPAAPATQEPEGYILVDADTGKVLAGKNEHQAHLTASTVKLLTALAALERLPLDSDVPITARAAGQPTYKIDMREGEVWKLDDALHSLLIISANDAAFAIAERTSGSVEQFGKDADRHRASPGRAGHDDQRPRRARRLAPRAGGSRMSAYDLAVVARNVLSVPELATPARLMDYEFTDPPRAVAAPDQPQRRLPHRLPRRDRAEDRLHEEREPHAGDVGHPGRPHLIAVVLGTWDDTGWAGFLLDQGFSTPATERRARGRRSRRSGSPPPTSAARRSRVFPPRSAGPRSTGARRRSPTPATPGPRRRAARTRTPSRRPKLRRGSPPPPDGDRAAGRGRLDDDAGVRTAGSRSGS